jgi:hypothetical protein
MAYFFFKAEPWAHVIRHASGCVHLSVSLHWHIISVGFFVCFFVCFFFYCEFYTHAHDICMPDAAGFPHNDKLEATQGSTPHYKGALAVHVSM